MTNKIDLRNFVYENITPYEGDDSFLAGPTEKTKKLWDKCMELLKQERKNGGCLAVDNETISTINAHEVGYIDKELEEIV
jgi:formate C-acetyltransferase